MDGCWTWLERGPAWFSRWGNREILRSTQHRWGPQCEVRRKMAAKSHLGRGKGRQATRVGGEFEATTHPVWLGDHCCCATAVAGPATPP